jgi:nickel/cobalt transporter (NiCoT) family protein
MELEQSLVWLALLAYTLGIKHGLDADHLATIDGFVRGNAAQRPRLARYSGMLFSLGHGFVVISVATAAALMSGQWHLPEWLEDMGALVSILFLLLLGAFNLHQVIHAQVGSMVRPIGFKSRLFPAFGAAGPLVIIGVGILFALSFDTLSQALLFSIAVTGEGGVWVPLLLGFLFMLGMMTTDALNGAWTAWLIRRADSTAAIASRVMGGVVAMLSLGVAGFGIFKYLRPEFAERTDAYGLWIGGGVLLATALGYALAIWLARRQACLRSA